jgi:hypothetical protein
MQNFAIEHSERKLETRPGSVLRTGRALDCANPRARAPEQADASRDDKGSRAAFPETQRPRTANPHMRRTKASMKASETPGAPACGTNVNRTPSMAGGSQVTDPSVQDRQPGALRSYWGGSSSQNLLRLNAQPTQIRMRVAPRDQIHEYRRCKPRRGDHRPGLRHVGRACGPAPSALAGVASTPRA